MLDHGAEKSLYAKISVGIFGLLMAIFNKR